MGEPDGKTSGSFLRTFYKTMITAPFRATHQISSFVLRKGFPWSVYSITPPAEAPPPTSTSQPPPPLPFHPPPLTTPKPPLLPPTPPPQKKTHPPPTPSPLPLTLLPPPPHPSKNLHNHQNVLKPCLVNFTEHFTYILYILICKLNKKENL